jgi:hypothetical protein
MHKNSWLLSAIVISAGAFSCSARVSLGDDTGASYGGGLNCVAGECTGDPVAGAPSIAGASSYGGAPSTTGDSVAGAPSIAGASSYGGAPSIAGDSVAGAPSIAGASSYGGASSCVSAPGVAGAPSVAGSNTGGAGV